MDSSYLKKPVFLVGAERSGTTVLRLMLDHHPDIAWRNEFEHAVDRVPEDQGWPDLPSYYDWLETHRIFQASGVTINKELDYPALVNDFLVQHRDRTGKPIIGATVHRHFDRLLRIWPDALFIHILRDGRDVARSNIGMGWAGNVWMGIEKWIEAEQLWEKLQPVIPAERRIEVTYENLINSPEQELTRICQFLGLSYAPEMMDYIDNTTYDTPDPAYIAQWRRKLSDRQVQLVESKIAPMLTERHYELSGLPPLHVNQWLKLRLKLHSRWECARFRMNRNGFPLFIADFLSRKLGLTQWQKQVRLQLNEVETAHLK